MHIRAFRRMGRAHPCTQMDESCTSVHPDGLVVHIRAPGWVSRAQPCTLMDEMCTFRAPDGWPMHIRALQMHYHSLFWESTGAQTVRWDGLWVHMPCTLYRHNANSNKLQYIVRWLRADRVFIRNVRNTLAITPFIKFPPAPAPSARYRNGVRSGIFIWFVGSIPCLTLFC